MGLFLQMSGVIGAGADSVRAALEPWFLGHSQPLVEGDPDRERGQHVAITERDGNTTVVYAAGFAEWDEVSQHLSATLGVPVFSLHVHDGDLWMYILFVRGEPVDQFNPKPDYWETVDGEEREGWRGRADVVATHVTGTDAAAIAPYLRFWSDDMGEEKARPGDEFHYGEDWQIVDFMRAVGLCFPDESVPGGTTRYFRVLAEARAEAPAGEPRSEVPPEAPARAKPPWWKFW